MLSSPLRETRLPLFLDKQIKRYHQEFIITVSFTQWLSTTKFNFDSKLAWGPTHNQAWHSILAAFKHYHHSWTNTFSLNALNWWNDCNRLSFNWLQIPWNSVNFWRSEYQCIKVLPGQIHQGNKHLFLLVTKNSVYEV